MRREMILHVECAGNISKVSFLAVSEWLLGDERCCKALINKMHEKENNCCNKATFPPEEDNTSDYVHSRRFLKNEKRIAEPNIKEW